MTQADNYYPTALDYSFFSTSIVRFSLSSIYQLKVSSSNDFAAEELLESPRPRTSLAALPQIVYGFYFCLYFDGVEEYYSLS